MEFWWILRRFLVLIFWRSTSTSTIPLLIHRYHSLSLIYVDTDSKNVTSSKTIISGIEEPPNSIAIHAKQNLGVYIDTVSKASEDYFQIFSTTNSSAFRRFSRYVGVAEDSITSLAFDWITNKLYLAIETTGIRNLGRIEACPLDGGQCAVLLQNELDTVHSLVVDPINGYMYWLNKIQKRIERAWLNGKHLDRHPFHEELSPENISITTGLTLDIPSRRIYFIRTRTHHTLSEIVTCEFYNRTSCRVVIDNIRAYHMNVDGEYLFWTSIDGSHDGVRFCKKESCKETVGLIANTSAVDVFRIFHGDVQPERTNPNPCAVNNGDCSHLCLLTPGVPWRSCGCPVGVKLLQDDMTCEPKGVEKALLVAAASGLFYISLDTDDYIPQPITYPGYDRETTSMQRIVDVEYDPMEQMVYWVDQELHRIRRSRLNGSEFEDFITSDLNKTIESLTIDPITRNLFWIDSTHGRIEVIRLDRPNSYRKTVLSSGLKRLKTLTLDHIQSYLYFSITDEEETSIERSHMDGTGREKLITIPKIHQLTDIIVDSENHMLYWAEAQESKIIRISLKNSTGIKVIAKDLINSNSISKLGSTIYVNSYQGRTLTAIRLPSNVYGPSSSSGTTSNPLPMIKEISDSVIYGQTGLKAAYLHGQPVEKEILAKNSCTKNNGGCEHICVPIPKNHHKCLCAVGFELTLGGTRCVRPQSFLVYSQETVRDDLLRISTKKYPSNIQKLNIPYVTNTPTALAMDPTRGLVYWVTEHVGRHQDRGYSVIRRTYLNGTGSELVLESKTIRNVQSLAVDWVSGNLYISNGYLKRIEVCSPTSGFCKSTIWKKTNPKHVVVHPQLKKIFFADFQKNFNDISIMVSSLNGSMDSTEILIRDAGEVTSMAIDTKNDKIYWSTYDKQEGTLNVANVNGLNREQLMAEKHLHATSMTFFDGKLYFANKATNAIEMWENEKYGVLHENVPKIQGLTAAYVKELEEFNPCGFSNLNSKQCICLPTSSINSECGCPDQYEYDSNERKCLPPKRFLLVASKDRIIRYKIRQNTLMEHSFDEDPYVILPISNVGLPPVLAYDSISSKRFIYWIDAQDGPSGSIKRASDTSKGNAKPLFLGFESNCSHIFDIFLDELGRQLFVSCAQRDLDYVAFVHVWKIREDDNLRYVGKVISGDRKSTATDSYPTPKQIAVFNRLNALFYVDHSRVRDSPIIVRCKLNGKECETVVSQGLSFTGTKLYADMTNSRLIYTSTSGVWSRDVYVDHDVKRHLVISPNKNVNVAPVDERLILIVTDNDSILGHSTRHEDRISELPYNVSSQYLNQLKGVSWSAPPEIMRRISSVLVIGTSSLDSTHHRPLFGHYGQKESIEHACIRSECSHMCRIHYDAAAMKKNYECLCPNDYRKDDENDILCIRNVQCSRWQFSCDNGKECIHMGYRCDGVKDCSDNSDESYATCGARGSFSDIVHITDGNRWSFQNWTCDDRVTTIPKHLFCNGHWDCEDGSDEQYCQCLNPSSYFDCSVWKKSEDFYDYAEEEDCISRMNLCDGIPQCRNRVDEEEKLCTMLAMTPNTSLIALFDFRTWTGYAIVLVFVILALAIVVPLCCCCYIYRRSSSSKNRTGYGNTSTLLSTHQTMLSATSQPTHAEARVLLPTGGQGAQVELSMRTYPHVDTSDGYNTLPLRSHYSNQHYPHHHQVVFHDGSRTNQSYVTAMNSGIFAAPGSFYEYQDAYRKFYAPPPSAASMSTYGIVKPAGMRMMLTPRSTQERRTMPRRTPRRHPNNQASQPIQEFEQREYLVDFFPPPSYSEVGSAVKCSTPLSIYRRHRRNLSPDAPGPSRTLPIDTTDTEETSSNATRELQKHLGPPRSRRKPAEKVLLAPTNSRNPSSEESITKIEVHTQNLVPRHDVTMSTRLAEASSPPREDKNLMETPTTSEEPSTSMSRLTKITEESSNVMKDLTPMNSRGQNTTEIRGSSQETPKKIG